jgi:hypothetical protein
LSAGYVARLSECPSATLGATPPEDSGPRGGTYLGATVHPDIGHCNRPLKRIQSAYTAVCLGCNARNANPLLLGVFYLPLGGGSERQ